MHVRLERRTPGLAGRVARETGTDVSACDQSGLCTAVCPVVHAFDLAPHQVVRLVDLDSGERLGHASAPWLCTLCGACTEACPRDVDVAAVMLALRRHAHRERIDTGPEVETVRAAHEAFLAVHHSRGRVPSIAFGLEYKARSLDLLSDLSLGLGWLLGRRTLRGPGSPRSLPPAPTPHAAVDGGGATGLSPDPAGGPDQRERP